MVALCGPTGYGPSVSPVRSCSRTACRQPAVFTLTYVYADSTAVLGPLATYVEPHCYDLCAEHAERLTAPRGWEVVRLPYEPGAPSGDDLEALANAVREAARPAPAPGEPTGQAVEVGRRGHLGVLEVQSRPLTARARWAANPRDLRHIGAELGDLAKIFKAYDVRGVVPDEFDEEIAEAVGAAFAEVVGADRIVIAHDMRESSGPLAAAFARGATSRGADVINAGLGSTDLLYYASGSARPAGRHVHRQPQPGAVQRHEDVPGRGRFPSARRRAWPRSATARRAARRADPGSDRFGRPAQDLLSGYAAHLKSLVDLSAIRPLKVVVDAGNGMGGHTVPEVFAGLPIDLVPLYFELDGSFPNHEANPIEPANLVDLQRAVLEHQAPTSASPSTATPTAAG